MKRLNGAKTPLEKRVQSICNANADGDIKGYISDLLQGGCQSGIVGELIYYRDTLLFYRKYKEDIAALLSETVDSIGAKSPGEIFGEKWDESDPLALDTPNQNLLVWFAFEETARILAERNGIEV